MVSHGLGSDEEKDERGKRMVRTTGGENIMDQLHEPTHDYCRRSFLNVHVHFFLFLVHAVIPTYHPDCPDSRPESSRP